MKIEIPIHKKSNLEKARSDYRRWRNKRVTSKIYLSVLFSICEGKCPTCGVDMILSFNNTDNQSKRSATLDHIMPLSEILKHSKYGLQIMCKDCNSRKI